MPLTNLPAGHDGAGLFAATIAAHGGDAFLRFTSLTLTGNGTFTTPPQTGGFRVPVAKFTLTLADGGRCRLVTEGVGLGINMVLCGEGKGGYVLLGGRRVELPNTHTNNVEPYAFLRRAALSGFRVTVSDETTDETTADGKPLLSYQVHDAAGRVTTIWVESDTRLIRKTVKETARGVMTVLLSDYQFVSGIAIFGTFQLRESGEDVILLRVSGVKVETSVDDNLFL